MRGGLNKHAVIENNLFSTNDKNIQDNELFKSSAGNSLIKRLVNPLLNEPSLSKYRTSLAIKTVMLTRVASGDDYEGYLNVYFAKVNRSK